MKIRKGNVRSHDYSFHIIQSHVVCLQHHKKRNIRFPLFKLSKGEINTIDDYKKRKTSVLFAVDSMWEGIDIPGDILSSLIIVKLPFEVPYLISEYEQSLYDSIVEYKKIVIKKERRRKGFRCFCSKEIKAGIANKQIEESASKSIQEGKTMLPYRGS